MKKRTWLTLGVLAMAALAMLTMALRGSWNHGQARFFKDQAFHFQTLRALNDIRADGADTAEVLETVDALRAYTLERVAGKIKADVLILAGANDHFIPVSQVADFQQKLSGARSVTTVVYDRESGGAEHCQMGAQTLWHADFFDWMAKKFPHKT